MVIQALQPKLYEYNSIGRVLFGAGAVAQVGAEAQALTAGAAA